MRKWIDLCENYRLPSGVANKAWQILDGMRASYSIDQHYHWCEEDDIEDELRSSLDAAEWKVVSQVRDGRLALYREIVAPADWDVAKETRPHGFWSYSADAAHAHWAEGEGVRWLLTGWVAAEQVDWPATIAHNANPALEDEREVRLLPGVTVSDISAQQRPSSWKHPVY